MDLDLLEIADVENRWREGGGNPLGDIVVKDIPDFPGGVMPGPWGVTIVTEAAKGVTDAHRKAETQLACKERWSHKPQIIDQCVADTFRIETALWDGSMSVEQAWDEVQTLLDTPIPGVDPEERGVVPGLGNWPLYAGFAALGLIGLVILVRR